MATKTFADVASLEAAVAALTPAQMATVCADPAPAPAAAGSFVLTYPDAIAAMIGAGPTAAQLVAYASTKHAALRDGGIAVNIGTASTPDEVNVASDVNGRSLVSGCVQLVGLAASNNQPAPTFPWINDGGTQLTLTAAQMMTIGYQLGAFVQATYAALGTVLAAVAAGTITTAAAVDAAAWPSTSY